MIVCVIFCNVFFRFIVYHLYPVMPFKFYEDRTLPVLFTKQCLGHRRYSTNILLNKWKISELGKFTKSRPATWSPVFSTCISLAPLHILHMTQLSLYTLYTI